MAFDVIVVADRARISLAAALNILVSRKTCPAARFTVALPEDSAFEHHVADEVIRRYAADIITIPPPGIRFDGEPYRIENKINALRFFGSRPVIGVDADLMFIRPLPAEFLFRPAPAAVPEEGLHVYPWVELFSTLGLVPPSIKVLTGSGEVGPPWLNAGFIVCQDGAALGDLWHRACSFVRYCPWVPEQWPWLDQIGLPIAIAAASPDRTITFENILPARFNQNIFYWAGDQGYVTNGYVVHHHYRVGLIERYLPHLIMWTRDGYPIVDELLEALRDFDDKPAG